MTTRRKSADELRSQRWFAPQDLRSAVSQDEPDAFAPRERPLGAAGPEWRWRFPAASVSVVELRLAPPT